MPNHAKRAVGVLFLLGLALAIFFCWQSEQSLAGANLPGSPVITNPSQTPSPGMVALGTLLFNDVNLSNPPGQACSSCHSASAGFTFPQQKINIQSGIAPGAVKGRYGNRIPPTVSYAAFLPAGPPRFTGTVEAFAGGLFWDGHANGLTDQATFPLQNPDEMNNTLHNVGDPAMVVQKVQNDGNAYYFKQVFGSQIFSQSTATVFGDICRAIAAYESSGEISPFSSKYDSYIHGVAKLTQSEMNGLMLATGTTTGRPSGPPNYKSAHCSDCHGIPNEKSTGPDLWTNSCYDNIGVPRNLNNPYYSETNASSNPAGYNPQGVSFVDLGLGGFFYPYQYKLPPGNIGAGNNGQGDFLGINGSFKAPTLRNVDKRPSPGFIKAYTHNGYFKDLKTIVHFYNTRNLTTFPGEVIDFTTAHPYAHLKGLPLWPTPEYPNQTTLQNASGAFNSQGAQVGNLGLTDAEENDIVAFLKTLSDGYGISYAMQPPSQVGGELGIQQSLDGNVAADMVKAANTKAAMAQHPRH